MSAHLVHARCNAFAVFAGLSLIVGCQSTTDDARNGDGTIAREQVKVSINGEERFAEPGSTITLDYPVTRERNDSIPDWVINPGFDGVLGAVGVAAPCRLGTKEQLDEARLNGRLELASMLEVRVQKVGRTQLEQQTEAVGDGVQDNSRKSLLGIDRNISDIVLAGSRQRALWFDPKTNEVFVWMVLDGSVLQKVYHYESKELSVFLAKAPITTPYLPKRRRLEAPKVVVTPVQPRPPEPKLELPKGPVEQLESKLKDIETVPIKSGDEVKKK